jgi:adenylate cyclase
MIPPMRLGLGVHSGEVIAGMVGSSLHREYKVTGDAVNVAARIQELNKQFDSTLLVSEPVYREVDPAEFPATSMGAQPIRGRGEAIHIYRLI